MDIEVIVNEKIDADTDFQASLANLSDDDKNKAISTKKSELTKAEFTALNDKATKAEKIANDQKTRAEKAEKTAKEAKPVTSGLSEDDILFLAKADIHEDDISEVKDFAKFKSVSIKDALKNESLKAILSHNAEVRKSAEVANAKPARTGQQTVTEEAVLDDALKNNKLPKKGTIEAEKLFWARRGGKR